MRATLLGVAARSKNLQTGSPDSNSNNANTNANNFNSTLTSANATPTRLRPSRQPLRPPLQSKDGNAIMRVPPLTKGNPNNMPPYDKHNASRPLMPTLGASTKTVNRLPLTPRVAGSAPSNTGTSSSRRSARPDNSTTPVGKEDVSTPVSTFLSHNVTPRSGSRRVRVESPNSTPTGTPNGLQSAPNDLARGADTPPIYGSGLGITGIDKDVPKRPTVSFSPSPSDLGHANVQAQKEPADSKFFFASEAKTAAQPSRPPLQTKGSSNFFYANGECIPNRPQSSSTSAVGSTAGEERSQPKFFHANGIPDLQSTPYLPPPKPSSTVSSTSRTASPRLGTPTSSTASPPQRPSSPSKLNQYASLSSIRGTPPLPSPVTPRPQILGRGQSTNSIVSARRASIEAGQRLSHGRSSSVSSADGKLPPPVRKISGSSYESSTPGSPLNLITTSVPLSTPEEVSEDTPKNGSLATGFKSPIISPVKTGHSIDELNELAANARRERKVMDLEITNSSLEAINRTLEREMRKQTAELRRYRRLSRSGRLSIATTTSVRTSAGGVSGLDGDGFDLSDMSEEDQMEETESEEDTSDEGSLSPSAMEESDLRHRKRDEKRLQLDLSKHQQLLIDSQKMNQSLKRCLGWTEELINEGRKALEYHVRVSDVELGGRVLAPDEVEGGEDADNEGMSDIGARMLREARKAAANGLASTWASQGRDDRDSGIELDGAHREHISSSVATLGLEP
ncbi:hypothetical protein ONS95_006187 [Cadophora gregata]|uniref:uncharacterized protein n=1 Tax=Cadophora gregata TaxID=51156 RepID=UPI0026DC8C54|nr:uncharacterized protein ONS95_006187 [Cadophora gregata]KAK0102576.1 hypothetical protein ONS95_006187 [Cadophora gregata]